MNRNVFIAAGVVVLAAAVIIGVTRSDPGAGSGPEEAAGRKDGATRRVARTPRVAPVVRTNVTPAEAARMLRDLLDGVAEPQLTFREMEILAAKLGADDLAALLEAADLEATGSAQGWVRCALFAEWGRRDPAAAMAHLAGFPLGDAVIPGVEQAWFSLFRGWAERHPILAYEALAKMGKGAAGLDVIAYGRATTAIFRELARQDPDTAWKMVRAGEGGLSNREAVAGFFAGLRSSDEARQFLDEWSKAAWETEEAREAHALYDQQRSNGASDDLESPPEEQLVTNIATAWAEHDLGAAMGWLMENGPGNEHHRRWRASQVARDWASAHPGAALGRLADEELAPHRVLIGAGIIAGDPSMASQVVSQFDDYATRAAIMTAAVSAGGRSADAARFPGAAEINRPPLDSERYQSLLEAIAAARFPAHKERELLRSLHGQYRETIPGAQEALDAMQTR